MTTPCNCRRLRVAWTVEIFNMTCIVFAETKPKAQWIATRDFWDAGWGRKDVWPMAKAFRSPRFDKSRFKDEPPKALSEDSITDV